MFFLGFDPIPDQYKTQELSDRVVSENPFLRVYCPDKYKTQRIVIKLLMILLQRCNLFLIGLLQVKGLKYCYCLIIRWKYTLF